MDTESHQWNFVDVLLKHLRSEDNPCCKKKDDFVGRACEMEGTEINLVSSRTYAPKKDWKMILLFHRWDLSSPISEVRFLSSWKSTP